MLTTRRKLLGGGSAALVAAAAPRIAWAQTEADVAIIGAGLAGLAAARLLEASGARVVIIEAENRVGGRLHTLRDIPGQPEAGGIQVGDNYTRLHRIASETGVGLLTDEGAGAGLVQVPGNLYNINGISVPSGGWADSPANLLDGDLRNVEPARLLYTLARSLPRLANPEEWLDLPRDLDVPLRRALIEAGAGEEALRISQANFNGNSLSTISQVSLLRSLAGFSPGRGGVSTIVGGSQALPEAMAAGLSATPRLNTPLRAMREDRDGVTLYVDGQTIRARKAICTIPFSVLRGIPLETSQSLAMSRMIASLPYTRASFAYITARTPFWNDDGLPATLWSDDPLIGRVFVLGENPPMLKLWTTGAGADLLDRMVPQEAAETIIARIGAMRPSAIGQLEEVRFFSWQKSPYARGIYHHIGTGMAGDLAKATSDMGANVHYAGEHLGRSSSGMEAALESGETVAQRVAASL